MGRRRGRKGTEGGEGQGATHRLLHLDPRKWCFPGDVQTLSRFEHQRRKVIGEPIKVVLRGHRGHPMHLLVLFRKMLQLTLDWLITFSFLDVPVHALLEVPLEHRTFLARLAWQSDFQSYPAGAIRVIARAMWTSRRLTLLAARSRQTDVLPEGKHGLAHTLGE